MTERLFAERIPNLFSLLVSCLEKIISSNCNYYYHIIPNWNSITIWSRWESKEGREESILNPPAGWRRLFRHLLSWGRTGGTGWGHSHLPFWQIPWTTYPQQHQHHSTLTLVRLLLPGYLWVVSCILLFGSLYTSFVEFDTQPNYTRGSRIRTNFQMVKKCSCITPWPLMKKSRRIL